MRTTPSTMSVAAVICRTSQSGSTRLSASVVAYQNPRRIGVPAEALGRGKSGGARRSDIAGVDRHDMDGAAAAADDLGAAVVAGVEHHHGPHRNRQPGGGRAHRGQAPGQPRGLVVGGDDHHRLFEDACHVNHKPRCTAPRCVGVSCQAGR